MSSVVRYLRMLHEYRLLAPYIMLAWLSAGYAQARASYAQARAALIAFVEANLTKGW